MSPADAPAYLPSGTVYGTLLNFRGEWNAWASQMQAAPYQAAPHAPVLYIKTANTWSPSGADIALPHGAQSVEIGASLAMVIEQNMPTKPANIAYAATNLIANWVLLNDFSLPHSSFFRPPIKFKCHDGFLGIGSQLRSAAELGDPALCKLTVRVNGALVQVLDFAQLRRNAAQLLADVSEFMVLETGDVLMLGCDVCADGKRPLARAGDVVELCVPGFAPLVNRIVSSRMPSSPVAAP